MKLFQFLPLLSTALARQEASQLPLGLSKDPERPNIVLILTDDQDLHLHSLDYTPLTRKYLLDEGTFFKHHFCTVAVWYVFAFSGDFSVLGGKFSYGSLICNSSKRKE